MQDLFPELSLIPVVVIQDPAHAVPLAEALLAGGITSVEITLRTQAGLHAIEAIATSLPEMLVGSGTVLNSEQMQQAEAAGARFHVSPGLSEPLARFAAEHQMRWMPGVANASQVMQALEYDFTYLKLFPADIVGKANMLKQMGSVFPRVRFCPTGGVSMHNMKDYAVQTNVFAIGGSWLAPKESMQAADWSQITAIAKGSVAALQRKS